MTTHTPIQSKRIIGLCFAATFGLVSCTAQNQAANPDQSQPTASQEVANPVVPTPGIQIDGSSTVFPISNAIAKAFKQTQGDKAGQMDRKLHSASRRRLSTQRPSLLSRKSWHGV